MLRRRKQFRSESHNVFTEKVNKIDVQEMMIRKYKHLMEFTSYSYGTGPGIVWKTELIRHLSPSPPKKKKIRNEIINFVLQGKIDKNIIHNSPEFRNFHITR